ncbi:transcriptional regulator [Actinoallomurus sp. NPDC052274]|uniref:transcriptional regulator n=1 Tax=Actinoallomurus sp. NPDC052274 TaxID=3155420 RepID=UPI003446ABF1
MPADPKAIGARLRSERLKRNMTIAALAETFRDAASERDRRSMPKLKDLCRTIRGHEAGEHPPGPRYRMLYTAVFEMTEEALFGDYDAESAGASTWPVPGVDLNGTFTIDDHERLTLAIQQPVRVDMTVVDSLATILAMQRRLDDTLGPSAILSATLAQTRTVTQLLRETRGKVRDSLAPVAAEWVQFSGWLHAELRNDTSAAHTLTEAEEMADDAEDGILAAQAANFKGYLARQQGRPRAIVRHFLAAYHTSGAHPAQRLGDAVQAAQGYALLGEQAAARRLLNEAGALEDEAIRQLPPGTAYWLTPDFHHVNIGLALLALGEFPDAAEHLAAGLGSLPADQQDAEWTREYRRALAEAEGRA